MDGYAIAWEDGRTNWELVGEIAAGASSIARLGIGKAVRIFTGAPIPQAADTVIPQEWIEKDGNHIRFDQTRFSKGSNVRLKGTQTEIGNIILKKGSSITPGTIGLLASVGISQIPIYRAPTVALIVTGNELQELGKLLSYGQIYNSNGPVLKTYLKMLGIEKIQSLQVIDEPKELQRAIDTSLAAAVFLILSGGISVGDYDYVKTGLAKAGVRELFYKVKQRPGKPLFAGLLNEKAIFALPGNPASVITCFNQYVKPSILQYMGYHNPWKADARLPLAQGLQSKAGFTFFLKAKTEHGEVHMLTGQESFNLIAYGSANCLIEVPEICETMEAGELIDVYHW